MKFADKPIKFSKLECGDLFKAKSGFSYMVVNEHKIDLAGSFLTRNAVDLRHGLSVFFNSYDEVYPLLKY